MNYLNITILISLLPLNPFSGILTNQHALSITAPALPQTSNDPLITLLPKNGYAPGDTLSTFLHPSFKIPDIDLDVTSYDIDIKKIAIKEYFVEQSYLSFTIHLLDDSQWDSDSPPLSFSQCVDNGYIDNKLSVGLTKNWEQTNDPSDNITTINNVAYQSGEYSIIDDSDIEEHGIIDNPLYTINAGEIVNQDPHINIGINQYFGETYLKEVNLDVTDSEDEPTTLSFILKLCFVNTSSMSDDQIANFDPSSSNWTSLNLIHDTADHIFLTYDGWNPSISINTQFGYFLTGYVHFHETNWAGEDIDEYFGNTWHSPLYCYRNIAQYDGTTYDSFHGYYIDTGILTIQWIDELKIKYYKGYVSASFSPLSFKVYKNDGTEQVGGEWAKALLRFAIVPTIEPHNGATPIAPPSTDLDDKPTTTFQKFYMKYWWWDPYYNTDFNNPTADYAGVAKISIYDPYDITDGKPRLMGVLQNTITTC